MSKEFLSFEEPAAIIAEKIRELECLSTSDINIVDEIEKLKLKRTALVKTIFSRLTDQQIVELARHPERPHTSDYIKYIFTDFDELHGDRRSENCYALITGIAELNNQPVAIIGHEKGKDTHERVKRNFGMAKPEGYRQALRIMELAEKFSMPVLTFIDTPGAYPGVQAEKNNQSEAIAKNLYAMSRLRTPIISTIIGEGFSGGALAIGVADRVLMLQHSIYATISPEGCASILWKDAKKASEATEAMHLTADKVKENCLIDDLVEEPVGGAHQNHRLAAENLKEKLVTLLAELQNLSKETLLEQRYQKLMMHHLYDHINN